MSPLTSTASEGGGLVVVDTDVLIWYMRGDPKAARAIDGLGPFSISSINYMELLQGIRDKDELRILKKFISDRSVEIMHVSEGISQRAIYYMEQLSLSHHLRMADALIAATASLSGAILLTANHKHYQPIQDIRIKRFRP